MHPAISTDMRTGSSRLQLIYEECALYGPLREVHEAEWPTQPAEDKAMRHLENDWLRWRKAQDTINADIDRAYRKRAEEVGREIDEDQRKQQLEDLEAQRAMYAAADAAQNQRYLDAIFAGKQKRDADWRKQATDRLANATRDINRSTLRAERKHFEKLGLIRGRRQ
jgi:hypothetical protein